MTVTFFKILVERENVLLIQQGTIYYYFTCPQNYIYMTEEKESFTEGNGQTIENILIRL